MAAPRAVNSSENSSVRNALQFLPTRSDGAPDAAVEAEPCYRAAIFLLPSPSIPYIC